MTLRTLFLSALIFSSLTIQAMESSEEIDSSKYENKGQALQRLGRNSTPAFQVTSVQAATVTIAKGLKRKRDGSPSSDSEQEESLSPSPAQQTSHVVAEGSSEVRRVGSESPISSKHQRITPHDPSDSAARGVRLSKREWGAVKAVPTVGQGRTRKKTQRNSGQKITLPSATSRLTLSQSIPGYAFALEDFFDNPSLQQSASGGWHDYHDQPDFPF